MCIRDRDISELEKKLTVSQQELKSKEQELHPYIREIQQKDSQINNLTNQLGSIQKSYNVTISQLSAEYKKEREEILNRLKLN